MISDEELEAKRRLDEAMRKGTPRRFRFQVPNAPQDSQHPAHAEWQFGAYFPRTDLCVTDMGTRSTGEPGIKAEWLEDKTELRNALEAEARGSELMVRIRELEKKIHAQGAAPPMDDTKRPTPGERAERALVGLEEDVLYEPRLLGEIEKEIRWAEAAAEKTVLARPVEMIILCLVCGKQHICAKPRPGGPTCEECAPKHRCAFCGLEWRVSKGPTIGVPHDPGQFDG